MVGQVMCVDLKQGQVPPAGTGVASEPLPLGVGVVDPPIQTIEEDLRLRSAPASFMGSPDSDVWARIRTGQGGVEAIPDLERAS